MFDGQQRLEYGQLTSLIHETVWTDTWKWWWWTDRQETRQEGRECRLTWREREHLNYKGGMGALWAFQLVTQRQQFKIGFRKTTFEYVLTIRSNNESNFISRVFKTQDFTFIMYGALLCMHVHMYVYMCMSLINDVHHANRSCLNLARTSCVRRVCYPQLCACVWGSVTAKDINQCPELYQTSLLLCSLSK